MRSRFDDSDYLEESKYKAIKFMLMDLKVKGWDISRLVACIYDLWMDYILSDEQEAELYRIADPLEKYNSCYDYWYNMDYANPLREVLV